MPPAHPEPCNEPGREPAGFEPCNETPAYKRFRYPPPTDAAIAALATAQHGIVYLAQLRALGLSASAVHQRAAKARLHRIHRGVYAITPRTLLTREGLWLAAVFSCAPGAVLSHRSAAALHGLRPTGGPRIDVLLPRRGRGRPGLRVHIAAALTPADVTTVQGIPCTTVARTLLDVAGCVPRRALERACDQAEILQTFDLAAIQAQLVRHCTRPGAATLKSILQEHYIGQTPTWSELEERFLALSRGAGLPDPQVNLLIDPGDGEPPIRVDFAWPERRLVIEADGRATHLTHQAFEHDRRRDQRVVAAGWRIVRTTWRQIRYEPGQLQATLARLYSTAGA